MPKRSCSAALIGFAILALGLQSHTAWGTTFVMMDEPTLLASSDVVVTGTISSITASAATESDPIYTYVAVQVDRVIKGEITSDTIIAREPGGAVGDRRQWVFGAPEFWVGERVLLFLSQNDDGTLQTNSLAMGKFTLAVDRQGRATAVRDLGEGAAVFVPDSGRIAEAQPETQPFAPLLNRLRRMAQGQEAVRPALPLQLLPSEDTRGAVEAHDSFTYLGSPPSRWFQPDSGLAVNYLIDSIGDSRLGFDVSRAAIDSAFAAWTNIPTSNLILGDGGTTAPARFDPCDSNRIIFNDPFGEISDPSGCSGILAIGGFCSGSGSRVVNGTTFRQITTGKVTFNNGWSNCSFWNQCNVAEVATHELGHTIGLGHSGDGTATMAATAHFDGRCAGLRSDDIAAATFIYPGSGDPPSTGTPGAAPPTATPPASFTNDSCINAVAITGSTYSNSASTTSATIDTSDPPVGCGNGSRNRSVWYKFMAPSNGPVIANTFGSSYDTILAAYTGVCGALAAVPGACNDDTSGVQSRVSFTATAGTTYYFLAASYSTAAGSLVFQFSFQGAGPTATFTATPAPAPPTATRTQTPTPTRTPTLGPPTPTSTPAPPTATRTNTPVATATSPGGLLNDVCGSAMDIAAVPYSNSTSTTTATTDASDPSPSCGNRSRNRSVWYRFTAPSSGTLTANTFGSGYDTLLSAYTGGCGAYVPVAGACNDDTNGVQSRVSFAATGGTTYYFLITSYGASSGTLAFQLTFQGTAAPATPTPTVTVGLPTATRTATPLPTETFTAGPPTATFTLAPPTATFTVTPTYTQAPPTPTIPTGLVNDACANALTISVLPYSGTTVATTATTETTDPAPTCGNRSRSRSVWYRVTAPSAGTLKVDTLGSNYDTILSAHTGSCGAFTSVACNDDTGGVQSRVTISATAGTTYYFLVTSYAATSGTLVLHLSY